MLCRIFLGLLLAAKVTLSEDAETFSCEGRPQGYYADVSTGCQLYHMCDGVGRQFSYSCPYATLFQQRMMICDHWYMVNCSKSEPDYKANLLIGQRDKPFLDDSDKHPYHRTPRPDVSLNSHSDIAYRRARSRTFPNYNVVGLETYESNDKESPKKPAYTPPSHWFTGPRVINNSSTTEKSGGSTEKMFANLKKRKITPTKLKYEKQNVIKAAQSQLKIPKPQQNLKANKAQTKAENQQSTLEDSTSTTTGVTGTTTTTSKTTLTGADEDPFKELRKLFLIPDYQFPLESEHRPGYDDGPTSFQVKKR